MQSKLLRVLQNKGIRPVGSPQPQHVNTMILSFPDNVLKAFKRYSWLGNVRELENLVQKLVVIVNGNTIKTTDLPYSMKFNASVGLDANQSLDAVVFQHISNVLTSVKNNKNQAAKILEIDRKTLNSKLKKMGRYSSDF